MTKAVSTPGHRPVLLRLTPQVAALCLVAAGAWVVAVRQAIGMGNGPGTMGLGIAGFVATWALMMTAMMLPSVAPVASLYARTIQTARAVRLTAFTAGYLAVWVAAAIPAYALLRTSGMLAGTHPTAARATAAGLLVAAGAWQLSGPKDRCLAQCRSPFALLMRYTSYHGPLRDLRTSLHHGAFCLGCCWALMALFAVFGLMNVFAMGALAAVVLLEKLWGRGAGFSRVVGVACLVLALAVVFAPSLTPGLYQHGPMSMGMGT